MLRSNIIANFIGRVWPSLLNIILVPVYLHFLGVEAYGLVGFFVSLQALISFLDLGLSTTTNREVALDLNKPENTRKIQTLIRTFEIIYGSVSIIIVFCFYFASYWLSSDWITTENLTADTVRLAVITFGATLAVRWPMALYIGVLQGAERQVYYNFLSIVMTTARRTGSVLVIIYLSQTILAYILWNLLFALVELIVMRSAAWTILRSMRGKGARVDFSLFKLVWRFSASVSLNSLFAAFLKQLDRVLISSLLSLRQVGYYTTANTAYMAISLFATPFSSAAFPRFASLIADQNHEALAATYHKLAKSVSFVVAPVSSIMYFYSYDILLIWTRSSDVAINSAPTLSVLSIAAMFNLMMYIPYVLQLAAGITWIALWNNAISLVVLLPLMYYLIHRHGIAGAGVAWVFFNITYYLIVPQIMHRYILQKEKLDWIFKDTLSFMFISFSIFGLSYWLKSNFNYSFIIFLCLGGMFYLVICLTVYPLFFFLLKDFMFAFPWIEKFKKP